MNKSKHFRATSTALIYIVSIISLFSLWFAPDIAARLGYEDGPIENLTALLFLLSSIAMTAHGYKLLSSEKNSRKIAAVTILIGIMFFIFAGEEISWGQRIFGIESGEFMQQHNWQGEINFHNLHTDLFNIGFHYGAFLFLVVMPLFRAHVARLLGKLRLHWLTHFIAPAWLAVPSFIILGMLDPRFIFAIEAPWVAAFYLVALVAGVALLFQQLVSAARSNSTVKVKLLSLSLLLIALGLFASYQQAVDHSPNSISEYKELVIAMALFAFTLQWRLASKNRS